MNVTVSTPSALATTDLLALAVTEDAWAQEPLVLELDGLLGGAPLRAAADERFKASPGQSLVITTLGKVPSARVALLGLGKHASVTPASLRSFAGKAARLAGSVGARTLGLILPPGTSAPLLSPAAIAQNVAEGAVLGAYRFDKYLSEERRTPRTLTSTDIMIGNPTPEIAAALRRADLTGQAIARARDLVNEPAGYLTPTRLASYAQQLGADSNGTLAVTVLGPAECKQQGMGLYLAVSQGSAEEPRFIHMVSKPPGAQKRVVLVGKGVTFDSGGLSLKTNDGMLDMKTDMAGAAAVISAIAAAAAEGIRVEVHALAACTENMPSGTSYKLGDVLRSKAGKTVEINNTDAEGRLTLADAITYGNELKPDVILDFATLTGACMVALGPHTAGVMSNDEPLAEAWLAAARRAGEDMWRLPLPDRLLEQLKSDVADMKNTGERWGGALTAGLFLREFVGKTPWVHVDIAGPASADKTDGHVGKGGTGFAVATILEYLRALAGS